MREQRTNRLQVRWSGKPSIKLRVQGCLPERCQGWFTPVLYKHHWYLHLIDWINHQVHVYGRRSSDEEVHIWQVVSLILGTGELEKVISVPETVRT